MFGATAGGEAYLDATMPWYCGLILLLLYFGFMAYNIVLARKQSKACLEQATARLRLKQRFQGRFRLSLRKSFLRSLQPTLRRPQPLKDLTILFSPASSRKPVWNKLRRFRLPTRLQASPIPQKAKKGISIIRVVFSVGSLQITAETPKISKIFKALLPRTQKSGF